MNIMKSRNSLYKKQGFTLIELLVVVSIIGILSSIVLTSLTAARTKAQAASIKSELTNMRTAASIIYSETNSYDTVCDTTNKSGAIFQSAYNRSEKADYQSVCVQSNGGGLYSLGGVLAGLGKPVTPDKWAASIKLPGTSNFFCVDYTGKAQEQASVGIYFGSGGTSDVDC